MSLTRDTSVSSEDEGADNDDGEDQEGDRRDITKEGERCQLDIVRIIGLFLLDFRHGVLICLGKLMRAFFRRGVPREVEIMFE